MLFRGVGTSDLPDSPSFYSSRRASASEVFAVGAKTLGSIADYPEVAQSRI